jgi:hypothetical protein
MVVRIGTWNLENLFKPPSGFGPMTDAEYDAKLDALASAITRMDPDVLAVQEVGDPVALQELADRVGGTWHIETADAEAGTNHTIRVGILSRVVLTAPRQVAATSCAPSSRVTDKMTTSRRWADPLFMSVSASAASTSKSSPRTSNPSC